MSNRYYVHGKKIEYISIQVEASSEEEALALAACKFDESNIDEISTDPTLENHAAFVSWESAFDEEIY